MGKTLQEKLSTLPQDRQDRIRQQAEHQIRQESVSRLEKRSDLHLSTLREVIQAMGGELRLVVEFPDRPPIVLSGFQDSNATSQEIA